MSNITCVRAGKSIWTAYIFLVIAQSFISYHLVRKKRPLPPACVHEFGVFWVARMSRGWLCEFSISPFSGISATAERHLLGPKFPIISFELIKHSDPLSSIRVTKHAVVDNPHLRKYDLNMYPQTLFTPFFFLVFTSCLNIFLFSSSDTHFCTLYYLLIWKGSFLPRFLPFHKFSNIAFKLSWKPNSIRPAASKK